MFTNNPLPKWWLLYLLLPVVVGLFMIEGKAPLSDGGHRAWEVAIVLAAFALVALWLRTNEPGIRREQWTEYRRTDYTEIGQIITIRRNPAQPSPVAPTAQAAPEREEAALAPAEQDLDLAPRREGIPAHPGANPPAPGSTMVTYVSDILNVSGLLDRRS